MEYKLSKYNYFKTLDNNVVLCVNLIKKMVFALAIEKYSLLKRYNNKIDELKLINENLFNALVKLGIIIDYNQNELDFLITEHRKEIYNNKCYRITIIPTLECNFTCWYCYEEHVIGKMNEKILKSIINHVKHTVLNENWKHLQLDWFGGEPLLYFDEIFYPLSLKIMKVVEKNNLTFSNSITTNGSLFNESIIKKLNKIKLSNYQITLDGNENRHNKTKKSSLIHNPYRDTIDNIIGIIENIENAQIMLRINYTKENLVGIKDIISDIPEKYRGKIEVVFQQVWQTYNVISKEKEINVDGYKHYFSDCGFIAPLYRLENKFHKCYADLLNQIVINFDGNVYKCTARDFANQKPDGKLQLDGKIKWGNEYYNRFSKTTIENENCIDCSLLPACWGPCSQKILEVDAKDFNTICNVKGIEATIDILLMDFYEKNIKNKTSFT